MAHVVIVGAVPESLIYFRGDLIRTVIAQGHRVTTMAAEASPESVAAIEALGVSFFPYPVNRAGRSILGDLRAFNALRRMFGSLRPDLILSYTVKPIVWSGCAARITGMSNFYALVEGLGYSFQRGDWRRRLLGLITRSLYFVSLRRARRVIFLNPDNERTFISNHLIRKSQAARIDGIGVDLDYFAATALPSGQPSFLCIARLLGDKGLREYAAAAELVRNFYPDVRISLIGPTDSSPDAIHADEVRSWHDTGILTYFGEIQDVRPLLAEHSVYVLPSYHEGMPRTTLEAMAMGRAIITTDVPGCRETVIPGENGYLVPKANAGALAERMLEFLRDPAKCVSMGAVSRNIAESRFDVAKINAELMKILGLSSCETVQ